MELSKYFTLAELCKSQTATSNNIINIYVYYMRVILIFMLIHIDIVNCTSLTINQNK